MTGQMIHALVRRQRTFFLTGATLSMDRRLAALSGLKACIRRRENEIAAALLSA